MRVMVIGASGAVGRQLVPLLIAADHDVIATTTREGEASRALEAEGTGVITLDLLDREAVRAAVKGAEPDVIVHQATALRAMGTTMRHLDRLFATTNRLRTEGTAALLDAARATGSPRVIVQSFCGWPWAPVGGPVKSETDPLDDNPPKVFRPILNAIREMEAMVSAYPGGVALRYGGLYGPATSLSAGGPQVEAIRRRQFPVVGDGSAMWSFTHVADAASAVVAALGTGRGVYNIVDDDPAPVSAWLPFLAETLGAKPPRRVPVWVARLLAGPAAVHLLTQGRGSSNAKARRELGWRPAYPSWRDGLVRDLAVVRS